MDILSLYSTQGIASRDQTNNKTHADEDARRESEGSPHIRHDPENSKQETGKRENHANAVTPQQHGISVLQLRG